MVKRANYNRCCYINANKRRCRKRVHEQHYCSEHLQLLTKLHVTQGVNDIVCEQMGAVMSEITPETTFVDDLNADSLDIVELVMEMEDEFDLSVPDEDIETISTIRDACDYIIDLLLTDGKYIINPTRPARSVAEAIRQDKTKCRRRLMKILENELFQDYVNQLSLSQKSTSEWITKLLRDRWVEHVTTIPVLNREKQMTAVHLMFLFKNAMDHIILYRKKMFFREVHLRDLDVEPEYIFDSEGKVREIVVNVRVYQQGDLDTPRFVFKGDLVEATQDFIEKYLQLKEQAL